MDSLAVDVQSLLDGWSNRLDTLRKQVKQQDFLSAKKQGLEMHKDVHFGQVHDTTPTICDYIWKDLQEDDFAALPVKKHMTIGWCFWHLYRIEDIVSNLLIAEQPQIFDENWRRNINSGILDTGNALSYTEAIQLSKQMDKVALKEYCIQVGKNSVKIIGNLQENDFLKKPTECNINRILSEGGVTENKHSKWLLGFWGKLTVGGLLTTPLTNHHMMHLPGCLEIKKSIHAQTLSKGER